MGRPVLPDEYSHNAGASRLTGSASSIAAPSARNRASSPGPPPARSTTSTCRSVLSWSRGIFANSGRSSSLTTSTRAPESFSRNS